MTHRPPGAARWLLERVLPRDTAGESMRGDAWEEFVRRARSGSLHRARLWYWRHVLHLSLRYALPTATGRLGEGGRGVGIELRRAARGLVWAPGSSATAVLVLAMGIGLSAFMFSVILGFFHRGLGLPEEERIRVVEVLSPEEGLVSGNPGAALVAPLMEGLESGKVAAWDVVSANFQTPSRPVRLSTTYLSPGAFRLLGLEPALGSAPRREDGGGEVPLVVSHRAWQRDFGGRTDIVGLQLRSDDTPMTVVGVMPPGFHFPETQDAWTLLPAEAFRRGETPTGRMNLAVRLAPGRSVEQLDAELRTRASRVVADGAGLPSDLSYRSVSLMERYTGSALLALLLAMAAAVGMVLLAACANVANLLVARAGERTAEVGVRAALGGSRLRVVLPFLLESLLLALGGAALGVAMAYQGVEVLDAALSPELTRRPYFIRFAIDAPVLAFSLGVAVVAALLAGIGPALRAAAVPPASVMGSAGRGATLRSGRLARILVVAEVALSSAVLVGAGVTGASLLELGRVDVGFDPAPVMTARMALVDDAWSDPGTRGDLMARYLERLDERPELEAAALAANLPALGAVDPRLEVEGVTYARDEDRPLGSVMSVSPGFFRVLRRPVVAGRDLRPGDGLAERVVLVDEPLARATFPDGGALGGRIRIHQGEGARGEWHRIVGIVPDVTPQGLGPDTDPGGIYFPLLQEPPGFVSVMARGPGEDPEALLPAMRAALGEVAPGLPLYLEAPLDARIQETLWFYRIFGTVFLGFGVAALAMAGLGLHAVVSFSVTRRRTELGVRRALGADGRGLVRLVGTRVVREVAVGLGLGLTVGWLMGSSIQALAFQVDPRDPRVFLAVAALVGMVALVATTAPLRRALRADPVEALRAE